jgi:hypothetical protein
MVTMSAVGGEIFTHFSVAGVGYIYIVLGMPAYLAAWLGLMVLSVIKHVPAPVMLLASLGGVSIAISYLGIN